MKGESGRISEHLLWVPEVAMIDMEVRMEVTDKQSL